MVEYFADKRLEINHQPVTLAELEDRLREIFRERNNKTLYIAGAGTLRYGERSSTVIKVNGFACGAFRRNNGRVRHPAAGASDVAERPLPPPATSAPTRRRSATGRRPPRAWAIAFEVADHVFGAAPRGDWKPTYSEHDPFHETFTTMAFIAAVTKTIKLCSGVLILPQRQAGLVAKQAAQVDVLSGGRVRLGVGVGWNHVEYEALGTEWKTRGARQSEQIEVMRRLWTEDFVTFEGKFHKMVDVNILRPVQRPIPIWFGGSSEAVIKRAAQFGDGWMPILAPDAAGEAKLALLREHLKAFGRDPATFGLEGWLRMDTPDEALWSKAVQEGLDAVRRPDGDALSDVPDVRAQRPDRDPAALQGRGGGLAADPSG